MQVLRLLLVETGYLPVAFLLFIIYWVIHDEKMHRTLEAYSSIAAESELTMPIFSTANWAAICEASFLL